MEEIVIVGAGSIGIFIADQLSRLNHSVKIIDQFPIAAYSSTRNQGWLQGGALYAIRGDMPAAISCRDASAQVRAEFPEALLNDIPSYYLFRRQHDRDTAVDACNRADIGTTVLSDLDFNDLIQAVPALDASPFRYAIKTTDVPIDTHILLRRVAHRAADQGAEFVQVPHLHITDIARVDGGWRLSTGDGSYVDTRIVVAAAGPYLPELLQQVRPDFAAQLVTTKIAVATLEGVDDAFAETMLISPLDPGGPNVVPYRSTDGRRGVTICLNGADSNCDDRGARDDDRPSTMLRDFETAFDEHFPSLADCAKKSEIQAHFYVCQKLKRGDSFAESRGPLIDTYGEGTPTGERKLVTVYPGKFTAAPLVAAQCVELMQGWLPDPQPGLAPKEPPPVARQKYFDEPEYIYAANGKFSDI